VARRLNFRLLVLILLLGGVAALLITRQHQPSFLKPGSHLYAYSASATDGTVSVMDLAGLSTIATIPVGPAPSGLRAHPTRPEIWGVSSGSSASSGFGRGLGARRASQSRFGGAFPWGRRHLLWIFLPMGKRAYVAASGSNQLVEIDCATHAIVARRADWGAAMDGAGHAGRPRSFGAESRRRDAGDFRRRDARGRGYGQRG